MAKRRAEGMPCRRIIREMISNSGMSASEISRSMGRSSGYVNTLLSSGSVPGADTFAEIAHACGYDVVVTSPYHKTDFKLLDQRETEEWLGSAIRNMDAASTPEQRNTEAFKRTRATFYKDAGKRELPNRQGEQPPGDDEIPF